MDAKLFKVSFKSKCPLRYFIFYFDFKIIPDEYLINLSPSWLISSSYLCPEYLMYILGLFISITFSIVFVATKALKGWNRMVWMQLGQFSFPSVSARLIMLNGGAKFLVKARQHKTRGMKAEAISFGWIGIPWA